MKHPQLWKPIEKHIKDLIKMKAFAKIVNSLLFSTKFAKSSILDVWQDPEFASDASNDLRKKLHLSCLTGF